MSGMLFSVIVPIYNVEKYLCRCIDSVLGQTFTDYELILVDDGSPDGCPGICDSYAEKADNTAIKVIHKGNGGLVSARRAGVSVAEGDYVVCLDADDALLPDALENMADALQKTNADIVSFSYVRTDENGHPNEKCDDILREGEYDREKTESEIFPKLILDENMRHALFFLWGRAIRRTLAKKYQLAVSEKISLGEDICCLAPCFLNAEKVYVSKKTAYLYTVRSTSISNDFRVDRFTQIERVVASLHASLDGAGLDFKEQISRYSFYMCLALLASAAESGLFGCVGEVKKAIMTSALYEEVKKAKFGRISPKSKITHILLKVGAVRTAFLFLYVCGVLKRAARKIKS